MSGNIAGVDGDAIPSGVLKSQETRHNLQTGRQPVSQAGGRGEGCGVRGMCTALGENENISTRYSPREGAKLRAKTYRKPDDPRDQHDRALITSISCLAHYNIMTITRGTTPPPLPISVAQTTLGKKKLKQARVWAKTKRQNPCEIGQPRPETPATFRFDDVVRAT